MEKYCFDCAGPEEGEKAMWGSVSQDLKGGEWRQKEDLLSTTTSAKKGRIKDQES